MNYELQVNALRLSPFYRHCSLCLSRGFFMCSSEAKSEFNAEVNQPYEAYVMVYKLAISFGEKTF